MLLGWGVFIVVMENKGALGTQKAKRCQEQSIHLPWFFFWTGLLFARHPLGDPRCHSVVERFRTPPDQTPNSTGLYKNRKDRTGQRQRILDDGAVDDKQLHIKRF